MVLELAVQGAPGWVSGYTNAFPRTSIELFEACRDGDMDTAVPLYRMMHPLMRWDSKVEFVQAIKLSMDIAGRYGGPCRPPRIALTEEHSEAVRIATELAIVAGAN
jgi:4-hydroxy-tetrahydrodipicolinate synthase